MMSHEGARKVFCAGQHIRGVGKLITRQHKWRVHHGPEARSDSVQDRLQEQGTSNILRLAVNHRSCSGHGRAFCRQIVLAAGAAQDGLHYIQGTVEVSGRVRGGVCKLAGVRTLCRYFCRQGIRSLVN
jgi:hypothetical protein